MEKERIGEMDELMLDKLTRAKRKQIRELIEGNDPERALDEAQLNPDLISDNIMRSILAAITAKKLCE